MLSYRTPQSKETQSTITPEKALQLLKEGNERFRTNLRANRDLMRQVDETAGGQWPFAAILSCIDSRTSAEIVFDQGLGDIFNARVAGNFVNEDVLGSLEYACQVAGARLVVVLGHTKCGAVMGACDGVELGNITAMLAKIKPAVDATSEPTDSNQRTSANPEFVQNVVLKNVHLALEQLRSQSEILKSLEQEGKISIVGAVYDVGTGSVEFL